MIICCSPTKSMISDSCYEATRPVFLKEADQLAALMKDKQMNELMAFYKCNEKIAYQNMLRFKTFNLDANNNAALCFTGLQFKRMNIREWKAEDWDYAQKHLRILSGLYGMLRVKDGICEYRLDVENPLRINGKSLIDFWQPKICGELADEILLDCCSKEYSELLPKHKITVFFYVVKQGKLKMEATAAKIARGSLIRYCVQNKVKKLHEIYDFSDEGFTYQEDLSDLNRVVFVKGERQ